VIIYNIMINKTKMALKQSIEWTWTWYRKWCKKG